MKNLLIIGAVALLVAGATVSVSAGELGSAVPATTLSSMGFGGAEIMTDDAGLAVRGKGTYASVWGNSSANFNGFGGSASAYNQYGAGASHKYGGSAAAGSSNSFAGAALSVGRHTATFQIISGGGASAFAH